MIESIDHYSDVVLSLFAAGVVTVLFVFVISISLAFLSFIIYWAFHPHTAFECHKCVRAARKAKQENQK